MRQIGKFLLCKLTVGEIVDTWKIRRLLGEGGFGAVYEVVNTKTELSYAMKTELMSEALKVLKMEVYVMRQANTNKAKHIVQCEDTGSYNDFLYVVMTMVGKSLQDVRKMCPGQKFSLGTALSIGIQSLEAIEELHQIGFLHRDIKPSNFAIGRPEINELRKVYLLDFGMCRRYTDDNKQIRRPRSVAGFRGTIRYAPLSCHIRRETCRKDDIESWLYQQIEITRGALPWRSLEEKNEVCFLSSDMT
uniref:Protein kinase domain-containing protein n=1 Tax=Panagrolaimus superbus TaxID=310955 RepID=A0A914Y954_9BILA